MKKTISLILSLIFLTGSFAACGKSDPYAGILTYKYNYDLSEYIDLANYKGIPAEGYRYEVTDEIVNQQILATRSFYSRLIDVTDRGAEMGDTVYIDYTGSIDGETLDAASETDCELTLGTGTFPEDFERAIVGATPESSLSFDVTFPDPYPASPDMSGKTVHFDVTVHEVCEQELPDYTEDFVRGYLGYDSIADFEAGVRKLIEERYQSLYYTYVVDQVWSVVSDNTTVKKYPDREYKDMYDEMVTSVKVTADSQGINFADFVSVVYNKTEDEFYEYAKQEAERRVKEEMICYAIARAENITLTDEEYSKRATEYALDYYGLESLDAFEAIYSKETICQILMIDKVKEKIADYADVTYKN